jgi:hypothetical protein
VKRSRAKRWARVMDAFTWPNILRRYLLASRADRPITESDVASDDLISFTPDQLAVKIALAVGAHRWWQLPGEMHVRALALLCDDMLNGAAVRGALAARVDATTQLAVRSAPEAPLRRRRQIAAQVGTAGVSDAFTLDGVPLCGTAANVSHCGQLGSVQHAGASGAARPARCV